MTVLEEALKVEMDKLEEEEKILKDKLINTWAQSRYVEKRLLLVCGLLGTIKTKEVAEKNPESCVHQRQLGQLGDRTCCPA